MIYTFTIFSMEDDTFTLEIKADAENTFSDLHSTILTFCKYEDKYLHRFLICNERGEVETQVLQTAYGTNAEDDVLLMKDVPLEDLLEDEGQQIAYLFDPAGKRVFMMELSKIQYNQHQVGTIVSRHCGEAPLQDIKSVQEVSPAMQDTATEHDEEFYGDDGFEEGEIDLDGFEIQE